MKRLWKVGLGRNGEYKADALEMSILTIGFGVKSRRTWTLVPDESGDG